MTPSQTKRQVNTPSHQPDSHTDPTRSQVSIPEITHNISADSQIYVWLLKQVTAAQVEIYPTKTSSATTEHMDSSHSASPTTTWNSRKQTSNNNMREIDQAHGRSEGKQFLIFATEIIYIFHFNFTFL